MKLLPRAVTTGFNSDELKL